jgi:hypothetical protein
MPNPEPSAALLTISTADETNSPILLKERKLDLLSKTR